MTKLLIITDSQGKRVTDTPNVTVMCRGGAMAVHLDEILTKGIQETGDISHFDAIAIWVGGNDAIPRSRDAFNPVTFSSSVMGFIKRLQYLNSGAVICLVTATPRTKPEGITPALTRVNATLSAIAKSSGVRLVNVYKSVNKPAHTVHQRLVDGVHLSEDTIDLCLRRILECVAQTLILAARLGPEEKRPSIDTLLPTLKLMSPAAWSRTTQVGGKTFVKGSQHILSMFYPSPLVINGLTFPSAEHAYQHEKCMYLGFTNAAHLISTTTHPARAKQIGRSANVSQYATEQLKLRILSCMVEERWLTQQDFRAALISTGTSEIVHNVPDDFWGDGRSGAGLNMYGKTLMNTRHRAGKA